MRNSSASLRLVLLLSIFFGCAAAALGAEENSNLPAIFIAGDSTAERGAGPAQQGWAVPFANYFDPAKARVVNRARGGRSSRTFLSEGLWAKLISEVKKGDIVLIQFGHNDGGPLSSGRARASLPGLGEETQSVAKGEKTEVVHTYGWYLRTFIAETKAKGATPIVLSLTVRNEWRDGRIERGSGQFGQWAYEVAKREKVLFVDVTSLAADSLEALEQEKVKAFYPKDHTHFNADGAELHATAVVAGLKGLKPSPVSKLLSAKGEAVEADKFSWLRLATPANPKLPTLFLIGDSTVRNGRGDGASGQWGWGDYLQLNRTNLNVVNRAVGGLSSRTYLTQGHWAEVLRMMKKGDFVMMQFGHNDGGAPTGRASLNGFGDETTQVDDEVVKTYGAYLRQYIVDARAKGATPIVCSPVPRKIWKDGKISRGKNGYAGWAESVAKSEHVPFVDLNEIIAARYDEMGVEKVNALFADEHTHTNEEGAILNAEIAVAGLRALQSDPLRSFLPAR